MKKIKCPQCGEETVYSDENPYRPFCSERCRLIDLGEWASESYQIPEKSDANDYSSSYDEGLIDPSLIRH